MFKVVFVLFYLVFLFEFVSALIELSKDYLFLMISVSCYIIIQVAAILILHETKRVKLILTAKTSDEYIARMNRLELEKKLLIGAYLVSLTISYTRFTLIYESNEINDESFTSLFAFMIYIDIILN